jgi:hypothetical protein
MLPSGGQNSQLDSEHGLLAASQPLPSVTIATVDEELLPNFCPRDFSQLSYHARHSLRRMRRRLSLLKIPKFQSEAELSRREKLIVNLH